MLGAPGALGVHRANVPSLRTGLLLPSSSHPSALALPSGVMDPTGFDFLGLYANPVFWIASFPLSLPLCPLSNPPPPSLSLVPPPRAPDLWLRHLPSVGWRGRFLSCTKAASWARGLHGPVCTGTFLQLVPPSHRTYTSVVGVDTAGTGSIATSGSFWPCLLCGTTENRLWVSPRVGCRPLIVLITHITP